MTPLLIDVTRLMYRRVTRTLPTGIDRVSLAYIDHYAGNARAVLSLGPFSAPLSASDSAKMFGALQNAELPISWLAVRCVLKAVLWRWLCLGFRGSFLFNTGHIGLENRRYALGLRRAGARPIVVVHDLIPLTHPEYCRPGEGRKHLARMRAAIHLSAGVVANSRHTLEVLTQFAAKRQWPLPPAVVAPLAPGLPMSAAGPRLLQEPYFLVLGTIEPRKNHWMLLQLWRKLHATMGDAVPRLVVIGQRGWECENVVDLLERCEQLQGIIVERSACSDTDLNTWLHHAQALLFPSFAEGYGLPLAEALARNVPAICSDLPVFREIAGDIPEYADPLDGARWEALVRDYATPQSALRSSQLVRMQGYRATTWPQHFAIVDAMLQGLDAPRPGQEHG